MKQTIILAPGAKGTEILRSLAIDNKDSLGLRIMDARELSERMLLSAGTIPSQDVLPSNEEAYLIASFLHEIPYFGSSSFTDAQSLSNALNTIRSLLRCKDDERLFEILDRGEFSDKNNALKAVYERYRTELKDRGICDGTDLLYEALERGSSFEGDFCFLKEFPLKPLEEEILKKASDGNFREISLNDLIGKKEEGKFIYTKAYGTVNEAEDILSRIFREGYPLDKCVIACTDTRAYGQLFYDLSCRYGISITFSEGVSILNTNPGRLLKLFYDRQEEGLNGIDATFDLLNSPLINKTVLNEIIGKEVKRGDLRDLSAKMGSLRIGFNDEWNSQVLEVHERVLMEDLSKKHDWKKDREKETLEWTKKLAELFSRGIPDTLQTLCAFSAEEPFSGYDQSALMKISGTIDTANRYLPEEEVFKLIPMILRQNCGRKGTKEGELLVTSIRGALSSVRENLFICGLSANVFPGFSEGNPLLLDSDLIEFNEKGAPFSYKRIQRKKEDFHALVSYARKRGSNIFFSYPSYDLVTLKNLNPSSVLYEFYSSSDPSSTIEEFTKQFFERGFFESHLSKTEKTLRDYLNNRKPVVEQVPEENEGIGDALDRRWSPSALEVFFECPRRFYLERILRLENDQPDDPYQVLPATDAGTLVHSLMEVIGEKPQITKEEFLIRSSIEFDRVLTGRPPIDQEAARQFKEEFLEMMENAYEQDPKRGALSAEEEEFRYDYPNGIHLRGYPDRIEGLGDGRSIIVDFKSKRTVDHHTDDIDSCLQVVIYAWLASKKGMRISEAEYRYTRLKRQIKCSYSQEIRNALDKKMNEFKDALDHNEFPFGTKKESERCKYCTLGSLCGKDGEVNSDDE